jgi:hypothetical protein
MNPTVKRWFASVGTWTAVLGGIGFACGFLGPIVLDPGANQGPLLGIFITGPAGVVLGAFLGNVAAALGLPPGRSMAALGVVGAAGGLTILFFCLPEPQYRAELVEIEVTACELPLARRDAAFAEWEKMLAASPWAHPRADWKETFERDAASGAVLTTRVLRHRGLFTERKPWNRGHAVAGPWLTETDRRATRPNEFYVRAACAAFPAGTRGVYLARGEDSNGWPSRTVSTFLRLRLIEAPSGEDLALP